MTGATPNHDFIAGFQRGSFRAVLNIYTIHYQDLLTFATQLTENEQAAHDIVVDTFIKVVQRRAQFDSLPNIKAFLYITVRNISLDFLRFSKQNGTPSGEVFRISANSTQTEDDKVQPQVILTMQAVVDSLPAAYQTVFKMMYVNGSTVTQISEELGITPRTVLQYKSKAIHLLQEGLTEKGQLSIPVLVYFLAVVCPQPTILSETK